MPSYNKAFDDYGGKKEFNIIKSCVTLMTLWAKELEGDNVLRVYAFGSEFRDITGYFTNNLVYVANQIAETKQTGRGETLDSCIELMLQNLDNSTERQDVFVIWTNRDPMLEEKTMEKVLEKNIKIAFVFIGEDETPKDLERWAKKRKMNPISCVKAKTYEKLQSWWEFMAYSRKNIQPFQCKKIAKDHITFYFCNIYANDVDHIYEITYTDLTADNIPIKLTSEWKNVSVVFLKPNTKYGFRYRVRDEDGVFTEWSNQIVYRTASDEPDNFLEMNPREEIETVKKSMKKVSINKIAKEQEVEAINILIFGRRGAGKSSFLQSLIWALTGEKTPRQFKSDSQPQVVTDTLEFYTLEHASKYVKFWDMFGIEGPNYEEVLPFMMRGQVLGGVKNGLRPSRILPESLGRAIHSVIFLMDPSTLHEEREMNRVKRTLEPLIKAKIPIIPVLTKIDDYLGLDNSHKFKDVMKDLRVQACVQDFYLALDEVFPIEEIETFVNYVGTPAELDPHRDLRAVLIAKRAIEQGTNYVNTREKKISVSNIPLYFNSFSNYVGLIEDPLGEVDKMSIVRTIIEEQYPSLVSFVFVSKKGDKVSKSNEGNVQLGNVLTEYDRMPALLIRVDEAPYSESQLVVRSLTNFRKLQSYNIGYEESLISVRQKIESSGVKFYSFIKMIDKKYFPVGLVNEGKSSIMNIAIENGNGYDIIIKF